MVKQKRQAGIHLHRTSWKSVKTGKYCEYYWILIAKNGKTIAKSSETYKTKRSAVKSILIAACIFKARIPLEMIPYYDHTLEGSPKKYC